ncbi:MAG TPA: ABC transporter substrate-binding protein [Falsiroseomonas sp.]|jgi:iron(III) transport system substrate-binding protein|nr:ABC transporter substrate-binding protein [Falsiroseomonas sp.]
MARGRLTLLSAAEQRYCAPLLDAFAAAHPDVALDFVFGISTDLHQHYLAEHAAGGPTADLVWSSAMDLQMALVLEGHAQPHGVIHDLPPGAAYRDLALATTSEPLVTLIRAPDAPAGTPAELAGLLRHQGARFRGRVAVLDIEANGLGFLAMLRWSLEAAQFDAFLEALRGCSPRAAGSAVALVKAVEQEADLALHVLGAYAARAVAADRTLRIASSAEPAPAVARIAFIPRRAANPEAASAFLRFTVSPAGQAALGEAGLFPITAPPQQPLSPIPIDAGFERLLDETARAALLARWRQAIGRKPTTTGGGTAS